MTNGIVPPYLLTRIARLDDSKFATAAAAARNALEHDATMRAVRLTFTLDNSQELVAEIAAAPDRTISDAAGTESLPGTVVRREGEDPVSDAAADEAYDGLGATFALFQDVYGRNSIDGIGLPLDASVHYGKLYDNAFWNGERMVFGDGDGEIFARFTASLSVIGHKLGHGVIQYTAGLVYLGQSGALNESVSDVFGALVEQHSRGESAAEATWLIGAGIFTDEVEGSALRSMKAPGTAYDDDVQLEPTAAVAPTADLVLWSRLGDAYEPQDLTTALELDNSLFELALLVRPMEDLPLFRAEMAGPPKYESTARWLDDNAEFRQDILDRLEVDGPLTSRELPDTSIVSWPSNGWNNNRNVMMMLECMMMRGDIAVAKREGRDRLWDLAERVYHSDTATVPLDEALRIRASRRLRSQGVVWEKTPDLPVETTRVGSAGEPATIEGLKGTWRVDPDAVGQPFDGRTALLSPFDGLVRDRRRMKDLFEFDYTLEMYKPAAKRRWGYYALPILHGDRLVGKVDATADRDRGILVVHAVHEDEEPFPKDAVHAELQSLADWLGMKLAMP